MTPEPGKIPADLAAAASISPAGAGPAAGSAPAASPTVGRDWKREAADIVDVIASLRHVFPSLAAIYTDQTKAELANAWAPILERHDIDLGRFMIYFTAAGVTVPIAVATGRAIKADIAAAKTGASTPSPEAPAPAPTAAAPIATSGDADVDVKPNRPMAAAGPADDTAPPVT